MTDKITYLKLNKSRWDFYKSKWMGERKAEAGEVWGKAGYNSTMDTTHR